MTTPQAGIFALGTASHAYLELDAVERGARREVVAAVSALREPRTTMGGVNLVAGFRPELWREVAPGDAASGLEGFNADVEGIDGFVMPATQHDAVLWISGSAYDVVFDVARAAMAELAAVVVVAEETSSWPYRHDLDLTGFVDGTEQDETGLIPERRLYCDDWEQASHGGEFAHAVEAGLLQREDVVNLGDVLAGDAPGRQHDLDITLFDSTGLAIQDLAIALAALERADEFDLPRLEL